MLRSVLLGTAMLLTGPAQAADLPQSGARVYVYGKAPRAAVAEESDVLFTPLKGAFPKIHLPPQTPILLGATTLPGYYGSNHSYEYLGPYYGGGYRYRLPYACNVLGYYCSP
jgi:hypothetical protein